METEVPWLLSTSNKINSQQLGIHDYQNKFLTSNQILSQDLAFITPITEQAKTLYNTIVPSRLNLSNQPLINETQLDSYHTKLHPYPSDSYNQALTSQIPNLEKSNHIPSLFQMQPTTGISSDSFRRKVSVILMNQMMMQRDLSRRCVNSLELFSFLPSATLDDRSNERYEQGFSDIPDTHPQTLKSKRVSWSSNIQVWKYCDDYPNKSIIQLPDENRF